MARVYDFRNVDYDLNNFPEYKEIEVDWSRTGFKESSEMNSIASYLAMFAPALPKFFIEELTDEGDLVCDPFSGRGTTALTARQLNRTFAGSDLNPYALVLSRAKISKVKKDDILLKIDKMEQEFTNWKNHNRNEYRKKVYSNLIPFYSNNVLLQLIFLREMYGKKWREIESVEISIIAFALGLMHGPTRKDGSTIYFSLKMPNTISMAPNYVRKFAKVHNLEKPNVNIFAQIKDRVLKKFDTLMENEFNGKVEEQNALSEFSFIEDNSIRLLITSPPYLSVVNYTRSNWLKLWLLGYDLETIKTIELSDNLQFDKYVDFITEFLNNVYLKIQYGGYLALIVGDVHEERLIEKVWDSIKNNVNFKLDKIYWDVNYLQTKKVSNMLNSKKGKATTVEKVLLLIK